MLKHITIRDYAIVEHLELDLGAGMTVITGETGAGKSIMLDALGLCVGDRAEARTVRPGAKRADVTAMFDLSQLDSAKRWLAERELENDEATCLLRRTVSADGRSKAFINGTPSTLADCAALGQLLLDIHSQHAHQSLLRRGNQRALVDAFAGCTGLATKVAASAQNYQQMTQDYDRLANQSSADIAKRDLLQYQVKELEDLDLKVDEIATLEAEQKSLANAEFLITTASEASEGCDQLAEMLPKLQGLMNDARHSDDAVTNIRELLASAKIQLDEANGELRAYADNIEVDPGRLRQVESRLDLIYDLARKHRVQPEQLSDHHAALEVDLASLAGDDEDLKRRAAVIDEQRTQHLKLAKDLTKKRKRAAKDLTDKVTRLLGRLSMENCRFEVALTPNSDNEPASHGAETVDFLISTNPGAKLSPLAKVASGGELSRISLALQVAAAEDVTVPTMIFDEVDVGIGGAVAEVVGELLAELGKRIQVLCVTHLPQVAAQGAHHLTVEKAGNKDSVSTQMYTLSVDQRVDELARMLGGIKITENTRAHAREMLSLEH